jgi:hypothetical protein
MQAKKVFEAQHFERGRSPKASMDIGGIDLFKEASQRLEDLTEKKKDLDIEYNGDWEKFLHETLVGKKITAIMTSMPSFKIKPEGGLGEKVGKRETKEFTITVQDVRSENLENFRDARANIIVADMDNKIYQLYINNKIYFE